MGRLREKPADETSGDRHGRATPRGRSLGSTLRRCTSGRRPGSGSPSGGDGTGLGSGCRHRHVCRGSTTSCLAVDPNHGAQRAGTAARCGTGFIVVAHDDVSTSGCARTGTRTWAGTGSRPETGAAASGEHSGTSSSSAGHDDPTLAEEDVIAASPTLELRGLARHAFGAMGTEIEVLIVSDREEPELFQAAESEFERLESLFSRFRPDSELSSLNRAGRQPVSPELLELLQLALAGREATGGRFDPTVHDAIVAAGYDRTFEEIGQASPASPAAPCGGEVLLDTRRGLAELGPGVHLDLGGIAKGYSADRVSALLSEQCSCLVNAGGDLAVHGLLDSEPWPVAVARPDEPLTVLLAEGALATSGTENRTWLQAGRPRHHLIDPRTGEPAETDLLHVTAAGTTAVDAEIWAKALLLAGEREAAAEANARGISCVLVTRDGRTRLEGGLA